MRGEYGVTRGAPPRSMELPPHARRIRSKRSSSVVTRGTTSACAENTAGRFSTPTGFRNYLRMRGEYKLWRGDAGHVLELPPHARRILYGTLA